MRSDIVPGSKVPDYELTEHTLPVKSGAQEIRK
jgi:hypothetical protein